MSSDFYLVLGFAILIVAVGLVGMVMLVRMHASGDGERIRKMGMQGAFVPLSAEDIADDEERVRKRRGWGDGQP